jgi:hypothetical protein
VAIYTTIKIILFPLKEQSGEKPIMGNSFFLLQNISAHSMPFRESTFGFK